ncbi:MULTISPECIES: bifunctional 2-polyprenyl-6-hydroxyphenol methylase/3-demethylubiquinol 3-O-methyltransferase UbiG [unclassified Nocardioides]|uniref:class I SAM-dependent methyltransferase n=1 Tax=unclassified Nocardioides TaxID=2615069 RepID=UPI00114EB841|nr:MULTISPECIES: class I SAM-dependent methyltransferase [unclassified Nocardioides]TQK69439.1 methyltransferase family protein [Nocardioides sp. SLBN-35]WGY01262.1 class I SAM-dependent methyltransferase [Nocardioides sp. QY071]
MSDAGQGFQPGETLSRLYPEVRAGGYTRYDGFIEFYTRVNALLGPDSRVLDFGAGRGLWAIEPFPELHRRLRSFHERVAEVHGVDVDPVVLDNATLTSAQVIEPGARLPFADASFDLVLADHVLEHVGEEDAPTVSAEILRVLKPGGWLAARTPNKWGMIGIGARAVPNDLHTRVLRRLQPHRKAEDVFPVRYSMNTRRSLTALFPPPHELVVYGHSSEPTYFGSNAPAWRVAQLVDRLTPPALAPTLMVFVRKG